LLKETPSVHLHLEGDQKAGKAGCPSACLQLYGVRARRSYLAWHGDWFTWQGSDTAYSTVGATRGSIEDVFQLTLIVKVKEHQPEEISWLIADITFFLLRHLTPMTAVAGALGKGTGDYAVKYYGGSRINKPPSTAYLCAVFTAGLPVAVVQTTCSFQ